MTVRRFFITLAVIILAGPANIVAQLATDEGIILSPPSLSRQVEAGARIEETFTVVNQRAGREEFTVYSKEVGISPDGSFYVPEDYAEDQTSKFEREGWLTFEPKNFFLNKGETKKIKVVLDLPDNLPTDGYYLELAVRIGAPELEEGVGALPEIGIPLIVNYIGAGEPDYNLGIFYFEHEHKFAHILYEYLPVRLFTGIQNLGNMHVVPVGQIFVSHDPEFAYTESTIPFNPSRNRILAGASREFQNPWEDGMLVYKDGSLQLNLDQPFRIGHYFAQLSIAWDVAIGKQFATAVTDFWVIPWKLILAAVFIVSVQFYLIRNYFKKRRKYKKFFRSDYLR